MNVVYHMASIPISNPSWIVDSIHKTLQLRNMMSSFMLVATVIFFWITWHWYHLCLIIRSHQSCVTWLLHWWRNTIFFIVLGQCFISCVCGCFTICKWNLNITYPKRALVTRITFRFICNTPPPIVRLLSMNWKSLAYGSASNKPLGM